MRKAPMLVAVTAAAAGSLLAAAPAFAACPTDVGCTTTTLTAVTVGSGTLSVAAVAPVGAVVGVSSPVATLSSPVTSSTSGITTASGSLPVTTVIDTRLSSTGWTASASTTDFTQVGGTATIPASAAKFSASSVAATLGDPDLAVTSQPAGSGSAALVTASARSGATSIGANTVAYTPAISLTIPNGTAAGVYTATVTQSVS